MEDAIKAAKDDKAPIRLLVKTFDRYRTIDVDYHGGLRHPHLERIEGTPDYLTKILSPRKCCRRCLRSGLRPRRLLILAWHRRPWKALLRNTRASEKLAPADPPTRAAWGRAGGVPTPP